jgi:hypothetical protein
MSTVDRRFHRVSTGLKLIYAGLVIVVLTFLGGMVLGAMGGKSEAVVYAVLGLAILAQILSIVGQFSCLDVPEKVKATGPIYAAVALSVTSIALSIASAIPAVAAPAWAGQVAQLLSTAGSICFLVFLRRLAEFLGDPKQISRAGFVLVGTIIVIALAIVLVVLSLGMAGGGQPGGGNVAVITLLGLGLVVFGLVVFVSYANLVDGLRKTIDRHLVGRALE